MMSRVLLEPFPTARVDLPPVRETYLNASRGVTSWLLTKDHKRIALLYLVAVTVMFFIGGFAIALARLNLLTPEGGLVQADTYNRLFTLHGVIMVFFFLVPVIPATLGNFMLPMMIGAKDLAFPRLNLLSWYLYMIGAAWTLYAMLAGGVDTGWTFYTPYSSESSHYNVVPTMIGVVIAGFSSLLTGLNFIVTTHWLRAPGMYWFRLPIFVWTLYATSLIFLLAVPVLAMALTLVVIERIWQIGIFDPALGGDPVLFQHLFWFYSHPAVYIMILPGMGVVSELIPCFARKQLYGYDFVAYSAIGLASLSFLVWGHHMFVAGISIYSALIFSGLSFMVAIPSAIKVFNWTATLYKSSVSFQAPMLFALGFVALFTVGGLTGLFLASLGFDMHVHDTYFVIAHFHFIMVGGMVMAYMGGLHYWWPKMTGRLYSEYWARLAALIIFVGFFLTFLPQFVVGYNGMPRRYHKYPAEFQVWNVLSTAGSSILSVGYVLPLCYLTLSLRYGKRAGANPWGATGLEWQTPSPPPKDNFAVTPVVERPPYQYHLDKAQNDP
ncbi:MAG TPA: cbb3-type cytochrome c oxidase subunit I [Pirellulales bacterium]|jgi:cytochrome c oxidase subunit 1|nr:cbb3-type cytochrome c oxidase subunit I [Pirellulales bacterium]